jgi:hypothetical protein
VCRAEGEGSHPPNTSIESPSSLAHARHTRGERGRANSAQSARTVRPSRGRCARTWRSAGIGRRVCRLRTCRRSTSSRPSRASPRPAEIARSSWVSPLFALGPCRHDRAHTRLGDNGMARSGAGRSDLVVAVGTSDAAGPTEDDHLPARPGDAPDSDARGQPRLLLPKERRKERKKRRKAIAGLLSSGAGTARHHHHRRAAGPPAPNGTPGIAVRSPVTRRPLLPATKWNAGMQKEGMPCVRRHTLGLSERQTRE